MNVPFLDLKAINARHAAELKAAAARVIDSGWYVLGEEVKAFEAEFAAWVGSPHCVGTSDGLSALILALRGWKELGLLKDGDGVAVPANTYIASILAITENRLRPVLVEPDEDTYNLGAGKLAAALTPDVKAVLAVHLYGQLADMPAIAQLCRERGIWFHVDGAYGGIAACEPRVAARVGSLVAGAEVLGTYDDLERPPFARFRWACARPAYMCRARWPMRRRRCGRRGTNRCDIECRWVNAQDCRQTSIR